MKSKYYFKGYKKYIKDFNIHTRISLKEMVMTEKEMNRHHKAETIKFKERNKNAILKNFWWY